MVRQVYFLQKEYRLAEAKIKTRILVSICADPDHPSVKDIIRKVITTLLGVSAKSVQKQIVCGIKIFD